MLSTRLPAGLLSGLARTLGLLGLGMLIWIGVSTALLQGHGEAMLSLRPLQFRALGGAAVLILVLAVQLAREPVAGRERWRSRAWAALALAVAGDLVLMALLSLDQRSPGWIAVAASVACVAALGAIPLAALAVEAPRSQWQVPTQLALALLGGAGLFFALMAWLWPGDMGSSGAASSLLLLTGIAAGLLLACWWGEGGLLPAARYRLRWSSLVLLLAAPLLLKGWGWVGPELPRPAWWLVTLAVATAVLLADRDRLARREPTA